MIVDLIQDIACPFCRIGKRHLDLALADWDGEPVEVRYRAFFLDPTIPAEGYPFLEYMQRKGGGRMQPEQFFAGPRQMGAKVGLEFNFDRITHAVNTEAAHRLIRLSPSGKRNAVVDAIYDAYFTRGENIGQVEVLAAIAESAGLEAGEVQRQLEGNAARAEVRRDSEWATELGVTSVPFFIINLNQGLSGAHPPEALIAALRKAAESPRQDTSR